MSTRSSNKGFVPKTQKRFVPKTQNPSKDSVSNLPLSSSLRQSSSSSKIEGSDRRQDPSSTIPPSSNPSSRVRMGDDGNWVSGRQSGSFLNYLPQDEAVAVGVGVEGGALDPVESQRVVDLLNRELSRLLKSPPRDFWREVASDSSLHEFLDSYLQFRNRWYDFPHHGVRGTVAGVIVGEFELSRRVFMVFYCMSSNKVPGARSSDSLTAREHGALLQEKKLLDLPKLLDICAVYGHDNEKLTELLVNNAMNAQPLLLDNLTPVVSHFLSIVSTMHQRCSSSLEALFSSGGREDPGHSRLHVDFLEVMDFINDATASLGAFVDAYKPAAIYFSFPVELSTGNEELLSTLARLHDTLLPSLQQGFRLIFTARADGTQNSFGGTLSDIALAFKMLSVRLVKFGWKLLDYCYLSGDLFEGNIPLLTATKMFPAKVEDPVIRGDILVQTFREISSGLPSAYLGNQSGETFLQNVEKNYNILSRVDSLRSIGWIYMDDEQFQYLTNIAAPNSSNTREKKPNMSVSSLSNGAHTDADAAIIESKISQIKDLFPDYGKGFLSACLEVYNQNPEEVIQRILEGTLHEDLLSLDTSLEKVPPPKSGSLSKKDKGKGTMIEPAPMALSTPVSSSSKVVMLSHKDVDGTSSSSSYGRYTRKSRTDLPDSKVLDSRGSEDLKSFALASHYEYEDEYDDSFDDLGLTLVESALEENESLGDRIRSLPGKSSVRETESSSINSSSKWQSQRKPQFYVKDGKNYSYKVSGSIAAANLQEAAIVNQSQKELIHGLGRGGNIPLGAVQMMESIGLDDQEADVVEETGGRGSRETNPRGRGRGRGGRNHYRKDRATKKHFAGLGGY
eukprot:TRINITY_DN2420_c1_g1_i1.p1 TRINITY_DN2420_c1_g1~~TRINITY_DN2420_c1_g1_i1.p1  ORF type:complete len:848 (+),score=186.76 TRINITY_DN2420_c1_g1_i1:186-2729(+)